MGPSCDREAILDWVWGTAGLLCTAFSLLTNNKRAITGCHVTAPPPHPLKHFMLPSAGSDGKNRVTCQHPFIHRELPLKGRAHL